MTDIPSYAILPKPFAVDGKKDAINVEPTGTTPEHVNYKEGFTEAYETPVDDGGLNIQRGEFNSLGYAMTSTAHFQQCGGYFTFNKKLSDAIGGYPMHAVLKDFSSGMLRDVISLVENNEVDFTDPGIGVDGVNWKYLNTPELSSFFPNYDRTEAINLTGQTTLAETTYDFRPLTSWIAMPYDGWVSFLSETNTADGAEGNRLSVYIAPYGKSMEWDDATPSLDISQCMEINIIQGKVFGGTVIPVAKGTRMIVYGICKKAPLQFTMYAFRQVPKPGDAEEEED